MKVIENLRFYHYPLCPSSRKVRLFFYENEISFNSVNEEFWKERENFIKLNPFGEVPFLIVKLDDLSGENNFLSIQGGENILKYITKKLNKDYYLIKEKYRDEDQLLELQVEVDRVINWVDNKFYKEVVEILLEERVYGLLKKKVINTDFLEIARKNLAIHCEYFSRIINERNFFASEHNTFADIVVAAHISVLDYLDEIKWQKYPSLKDWYCVIKSRPSFHEILKDKIPEIESSRNYQNLDF